MKIFCKYHAIFEHVNTFLNTYLSHLDCAVVVGSICYNREEILRIKQDHNKVVLYNVEQIDPKYNFAEVQRPHNFLEDFRLYDEIWDYDEINIQRLAAIGISAKYLPLMYVKELERVTPSNQYSTDCLFYGSINNKRKELLDAIGRVCNLKVLSGTLGTDLDEEISKSRIILNCHYVDWDIQEQIRMFYPIINKKVVVSEYNTNNVLKDCVFNINRVDIPNFISNILTKDLNIIGDSFYENFKKKYKNFDFGPFGGNL